MMGDQPDLAGLLSIEALNTYDTVEARSSINHRPGTATPAATQFAWSPGIGKERGL